MASKYQLITGLYESAIKQAANSPGDWTAFLRSACRNYKCRFDEQILIYAQRPDATAVLEFEKWNKQFFRRIVGGAKGIAVFDDDYNSGYRLKHYFDISDTRPSRFARPVPLWDMKPEYETEVMESLENSFGELDVKTTLADALLCTATNAVEDNMADYLRDLIDSREDSFLEELDEYNVEVEYRTVLKNSVAYMMMTRCGIDAGEYFDDDDFRGVTSFNTRNALNALGIATSDIAEMCLREIAATALNLQRQEKNQNRTFAKPENAAHTVPKTPNINEERGAEHDRSVDVSDRGRLPNPEPDIAGRTARNPWQIRATPKEISETEPPRTVSELSDGGNAQQAPDGDRTDGQRADGIADREDGEGTGRDGTVESVRSDGMGRPDEQHPAERGGNDTERPDIRIKPLPTLEEQQEILGEAEETAKAEPSASSMSGDIPQEVIDAELRHECSDSSIFQLKFRTYHQFRQLNSEDEIIKLLKREFGTSGGRSYTNSDYWIERGGRGITFLKGTLSNPNAKFTLSWKKAAARIAELIDSGLYLNPRDKELYPQYLEYLTQQTVLQEKRRFIDSMAGVPPAEKRDTLSRRLADYINDLALYEKEYLGKHGLSEIADAANAAEIDRLLKSPETVQRLMTALKAIQGATTGVFTRSHAWRFGEELAVVFPRKHVYHLGDVVYIGTHEYEVMAFDDSTVRLYDPDCPLINAEMPRAEFDRKIAENTLNDHLATFITTQTEPTQQVIVETPRILYKKHLAILLEEIQKSESYSFLRERERDTDPLAAETEIGKELDLYADSIKEDDPAFYEAYSNLPQFREWLIEDILDRTYQDMASGGDGISLHESETDCPDWARLPAFTEQIREELYSRGFAVSDELIADGFKVSHGSGGSVQDFANFIVHEYLTEEPAPEPESISVRYTDIRNDANEIVESGYIARDNNTGYEILDDTEAGALRRLREWLSNEQLSEKTATDQAQGETESHTPQPGDRYEIQGRLFEVDSIGANGVSLRDITFNNGAGFPIFRQESLDFIRQYEPVNIFRAVAENETKPALEPNQHREPAPKPPVVNFPGEIITVKVPIPRYTVKSVSYADVISSNPPRVDIADKAHAFGVIDNHNDGSYLKNDDGTYVVFDTYTEAEAHAKQLNDADAALAPAWEKPKPKNRAQIFDPHPEIPMSERHNFRITDDNLGAGGQKTKYRNNVDAIRTLQTVESENRFATTEEQEILSRYVGWGGIQQAFDPENSSWTNEYTELKSLLSDEEYKSARASTLNAHYTSPTVIKAIYKAIENMGFTTGNVLEPSCGIGNFFGLLPESMSDSKLFGVELDGVTGRIARQLYQRNSIAVQGFESTNLPDSFFDVAIGNVPFGAYSIPDKRYDKHKFHVHDYFFARTLDKVRPGGVVAFVTSRYMMDKKNPAIRKYIAQRADLVGAIRLPSNTFLQNAGTEVTTDIIFLQKRDRIIDIEPDWVHLGETDNAGSSGGGFPINSYFAEHPDMVLGTMSNESGTRMYGAENSLSCIPFPDADLSEQLAEAVANIHAEITDYERGEDEPEEDNSIPADPNVRNFSYAIVENKIYYRQYSRMIPVELPVTAQNRVRGLIELRECVRNLIMYQTENYPQSDILSEQAKLNRLYDSFSRKYGLINSRGNNMAFSQDSAYCLLCSLEVLDESGNLERKADMFHKRTIKPHEPVAHVDTAVEALAVSISEKARVDLAYMAGLSDMSEETLIKELEGVIFLNIGNADSQDKTYVTADEYLSGNVREKLIQARAAAYADPSLEVNARALEAALPPDLTAAEISVRLGATWIPESDVQKFMFELLNPSGYARERIRVRYFQRTGEWNVTEKSADRSNIHTYNTYGTTRINAYKIMEDSLNLRDVRIFDKVVDANGDEKRVLNKKETAIAQAKQEIIRAKFDEWIWKDPERRERLCRIYNDKFNSIRPRQYDGSHIKFVGINPEIKLRKHQTDAIARVLYGGNTLLAHEVGAGKTFEMVAAAMESKRLGLCSKSLIVVPNHITEQWASEFLQLYPSANILVATKKDFETKNRKKFCARIATGEYDAVIIGHSQFERIPMSVERQEQMLEMQIDELSDGIDEVKRSKGERYTIKQMERIRKGIQTKLNKLHDQSRKDDVVNFEELGIDRLYIDESHYFKNLYLISKMRNVAGIAQAEAQKSSDLFMKCRFLDELTGGRGNIFATGTPISNSMCELYTIQRYLQYDALLKNDLQNFDAWASTFGETVTAIELAPEGTGFRAKTRFAKFYNLPELMSMFRMVADIQTADMLKLPVPEADFHTIVIKPSEWQTRMIEELAERAEKIRDGDVDPTRDNMLLVTNDGRKLALDQRLINPMLPDDPEGKAATCANNVFRIWEETKDKRSAQMIFSDLSTPKNDGTFSVYNDVKAKLITKGIPENEIAFIHDADTEAKKKELFAKVRQGKVRVLMGSTQKMGAGTNCQDRLIALHDLDCPWRPSDLAQRLGRIVRQGNKNPVVQIFRYVTEGTFDSYLYQLVENKQKFIAQIMTSKLPVRSAEDIDDTALSYAEIKALATGNPLIIEKAQLESDVGKLKILHASHLNQKYMLEDKVLKEYPQEIKRLNRSIAGYETDMETVKSNTPQDKDAFPPMKIGGIFYNEKAKAGEALIEACKAMTSPDPVPLGEYRGFQMILSFDSAGRDYKVTLSGALSHTVSLGTDIHGNITRLDNRLERCAVDLSIEKKDLADMQSQLETAKGEIDRPFPQEKEYAEKSARLKELNILLNMDEKDHELLDFEPDEGDMEQERKAPGRER